MKCGKSGKIPYIIYRELTSLMKKKIDGCAYNPEKSSTKKIDERFPCGYSMSAISPCDNIENKHIVYCEEDCMKKFLYFSKRTC